VLTPEVYDLFTESDIDRANACNKHKLSITLITDALDIDIQGTKQQGREAEKQSHKPAIRGL